MEYKITLGTVIANRILIATDTKQRITLSIGNPKYIGEGWDWVCPYRISGFGKPILAHAHGIDALQALQLVTIAAKHTLADTGLKFSWLDDDNWSMGFPEPLNPGFNIPGLEERLKELVVEEIARWLKRGSEN
jgi:hypothetical protein